MMSPDQFFNWRTKHKSTWSYAEYSAWTKHQNRRTINVQLVAGLILTAAILAAYVSALGCS